MGLGKREGAAVVVMFYCACVTVIIMVSSATFLFIHPYNFRLSRAAFIGSVYRSEVCERLLRIGLVNRTGNWLIFYICIMFFIQHVKWSEKYQYQTEHVANFCENPPEDHFLLLPLSSLPCPSYE